MNKSSINQAFKIAKNENRPALLTYTVAGDNTKKKSLEILKSISKYVISANQVFPTIPNIGYSQIKLVPIEHKAVKINDAFQL